MQLVSARIVNVGPFDDVVFPFCDDDGQPRAVNVIHGAGGVGKTTLLSAIAGTRPGHVLMPSAPSRELSSDPERGEAAASAHVLCDFYLGQDDPERMHRVRIATPNVRVFPDEDQESLRRREQLAIDKLAREAGFAFLYFPSTRWFSRQPITIASPLRSIVRHDARFGSSLDEATRSDLSREVKQALAYAEIAASLARMSEKPSRLTLLRDGMRAAVGELVGLVQFAYAGIDPASLEPVFTDGAGRTLGFDLLPTRARHLVSFVVLGVRTLWAAYPGQDPRTCEGIIAIDDVCLHQDSTVQARLIGALRRALPRVQWILTTTSSVIAASCEMHEVLALRRLPEKLRVELFMGSEARTH